MLFTLHHYTMTVSQPLNEIQSTKNETRFKPEKQNIRVYNYTVGKQNIEKYSKKLQGIQCKCNAFLE